jgi:hypothetical protein
MDITPYVKNAINCREKRKRQIYPLQISLKNYVLPVILLSLLQNLKPLLNLQITTSINAMIVGNQLNGIKKKGNNLKRSMLNLIEKK